MHIISIFTTYLLSGIMLFLGFSLKAQEKAAPVQNKIRILFLLDASFSMKEKWNTKSKFETASELLVELIDESYATNPTKEYAIRIFGHQTGMIEKDCKDSRLEVGFQQQNIGTIKKILQRAHPKGWSPIAYSLLEAINDFPNDPYALNAIIFITDGGETCYGDPCTAAIRLREHQIDVKPFVIGLGSNILLKEDVGCIGDYKQVATQEAFKNALDLIIDKIDLRTSVQVVMKDKIGGTLQTNIPFSVVNSGARNSGHNFIHTLDNSQLKDTIVLSLLGTYDFIAHTTPEVSQLNVRLIEDYLNKINLQTPVGTLDLRLVGHRGFSDFECLIRDAKTNELLDVQNFNTKQDYLAGKYFLEISSKPRISFAEIEILPGETTTIPVSRSGTLLVENEAEIVASLFIHKEKQLIKVEEYSDLSGYNSFHLQPGEYTMIYRGSKDLNAKNTMEYHFSIKAGRVHIMKI